MRRANGGPQQRAKRLLHPATFAQGAEAAEGLASDRIDQLGRGEVDLAQVLGISAESADQIWDAANALMIAGEYTRALAAFESLTVLSGPRADLCMARAACCEALGRRDRARRYYQEALTLAPEGAHDDVRQLARLLNVSSAPEVIQ